MQLYSVVLEQVVPSGTKRYQVVPNGTKWYQMVPSSAIVNTSNQSLIACGALMW